MSLDPKNLEPGKKYVIMITGVISKAIAECTPDKDRRGVCIVRVLNDGFMHDARLQHDDYIPMEEYDEQKHGAL